MQAFFNTQNRNKIIWQIIMKTTPGVLGFFLFPIVFLID